MKWAIAVVALLVAARFGWLAGVGLFALCWLVHAWFYPWTACWWCKGRPRHDDGRGNFNVFCPICGGRGRKRRLSSRVMRGGFGDLG